MIYSMPFVRGASNEYHLIKGLIYMSKPKLYDGFSVKYEKKLQSDIIKKSDKIFSAYERKEINHKKSGSGKFYSLEIGLKHRAIRDIKKDYWFVCSHETYNKEYMKIIRG